MMTSPETTPDHIAKAQAIHDELARWKPVLERLGCAVTLSLFPDRTLAGVIFGVVVRGTLPEARKKAAFLKVMARSRGFELSGDVLGLFRDTPDEWQIGLCSTVRRTRAPRQKAT
jgi:hypothetical protein